MNGRHGERTIRVASVRGFQFVEGDPYLLLIAEPSTFGAFAGMPGEAPHSLKKERDRSTRTLLAFQGE